MRPSLILLLGGAAAAAACVGASLGGPPASAQDAVAPRAASLPDDKYRDVEIMRRVLVREGLFKRSGEASGAGQQAAQNDMTSLLVASTGRFWSTSQYGNYASEAFLVPGQGALFILRTSDPVAGPRAAGAAAAPDKVWDEESAVLEGKLAARVQARGGQPFDSAKVDALKVRLLDALATYGFKIRGLAPTERLTVLVVGGGSGSDYEVSDRGMVLRAYGTQPVDGVSRGSDGRTVLTIHVSVADCQAAGTGSLSADEFRKRAVVSSY